MWPQKPDGSLQCTPIRSTCTICWPSWIAKPTT
jgi:hypothetical protein